MLRDKVIVVTGGAGLLGRAFCQKIVENNGICIVSDINIESGTDSRNRILEKFKDSKVYFHQIDITSKSSILALIDFAHLKFGKIDAIVNNAYPRNKHYGTHYLDVEYSDFCENVNLNLGGYFLVGQQFAKYFLKQGYGNIVNISSIYGVVAPKFSIYEGSNMTTPVEYAVIKSGLLHLTRYMASYFKQKNIRINSISLGGIIDGQPESFQKKYGENCLNKGMLHPQDISGTLSFLLSDESQYINGQNIIVDDGFTL